MNDFIHNLKNVDLEAMEARRLALLWMMTNDKGDLVFDNLKPHDKALLRDGKKQVSLFAPSDENLDAYAQRNKIHLPRTGLLALCQFNRQNGQSFSLPFVINPWFCMPTQKGGHDFINATRQIQFFGAFLITDHQSKQKIMLGAHHANEDMLQTTQNVFDMLSGPDSCVTEISQEYGLNERGAKTDSIALPTEPNTVLLDMIDQRIALAVAKTARFSRIPNDGLSPPDLGL